MKPNDAGGRSSARGQRGRGTKHPWLIVFFFGVVAILWVATTILIVPQELHDISTAFTQAGKREEQAKDDAWTPPAPAREKPEEFTRPVRPEKTRPEVEISMEEIVHNMENFLDELDRVYTDLKDPEPVKIWNLYKAAADRWLLPMDRDNQGHTLFEVRNDDSIFVSVASYRDENCPRTLAEMYSKADRPENVYIGLVQQNCVSDCKSGVLDKGVVKDVEPDIDCYNVFCATELGAPHCEKGHVRNFFVNEAGSLGPAVARYFASKLWKGETFFMQIDAHSLFEERWDALLVKDILSTPSYPFSVLSHYPPDTQTKYQHQPGYRICGAVYAESSVEYDIVRLAAGIPHDSHFHDTPCYAPFIGAGFFFAHSSFLADLPFDPYVPWVFMGEEILLSLRFWTWGYDIYSPTRNVLSHMYGRRHLPKFWETVVRLFKKYSIHNDITSFIIHRIKNIAGYPESSADILLNPSLLAELDLYGDGNVRAMEDYFQMVGLDMVSKRTKNVDWCSKCQRPVEASFVITASYVHGLL